MVATCLDVEVYIWKINDVFVQDVCINVAPPPRLPPRPSLATLSSVNLLYLMR